MYVPKPKKLPSGSWNIRLRLGGDEISITEPTEQACIKKARVVKAEYLAGRKPAHRDRTPTLGKLLDSYIASKKAVLSPATVRGYKVIRDNRFQAWMDKDPEKINWQRMVSDESRLCGPKTLRNAWSLVTAAASASGLQTPAVRLPQLVQDEHPYLEAEQIPVFLDAVKGTMWELPALIGLHGLRRSEMLALTWADVDLTANTISIRSAVVPNEKGKMVKKKETKNRSSRRTIPIMIPRLRELFEEQKGDPSDRILTCHPNSVYVAVNRICEKNGLPKIGCHGLRHSFASLAHTLGVPEVETMALGGWQDPQTMRKIYTHLDNAARLKATNAITSFFTDK
jgi:integrase